MPELTTVADNLIVEETPEGLDIVIADQKGSRMFPEGGKYPVEKARAAIAAMAPILSQLGSRISISGHTAAGSLYLNDRYGPWELSSDRANSVRAILGEFGLPARQIQGVIGRADSEPFLPTTPIWRPTSASKSQCCTMSPRCLQNSTPN
ncbi:OmpA family protein [Devosia rhodophyticola]|uniref:OmpA family protein n=1 Tax=Devosia rhodophyticola TaxID=3026423 RepID=A0ABY7Z0S1_9HYPH|nr:OmpA family protein [Devosia rhodophyticola]WDR07054.1 OmpA family protein [Devosia rhodophyticola]